MKHHNLFIALFAFAAFSGCKSNSTTTPTTPTIVVPNVGTSWTIQNIRRDSLGTIKKTDTSIRVVAATNMQAQGFSDVVMTTETNPVTGKLDTVYLRYLPSGDISRLSIPSIDPQLPEWLTVPYYTHAAQAFNFGGNITYLGYTHDTVTFSATYVGDGSDTIAGVIYPTSIVSTSTWQKASSAIKDSTDLITQTNSFIPSKGIFGGRTVTMNQVNGKQINRVEQKVIAVDLK
ncbi:MAG: hypothetical protein Q8916_14235 [Bacteroidota bacterium]|nr:hypothetical protein [Bacteroidota bacterium]MDP4231553.1 hypothetical protein [Bacteroidota bacterium]MDP4237194.1 hypothetical protein [Bacteroidota bacterium]